MKGRFFKVIFSTERNIKVGKFTDEIEWVGLPEGGSQKMGGQKHWDSWVMGPKEGSSELFF